jgi:hypothetical protein
MYDNYVFGNWLLKRDGRLFAEQGNNQQSTAMVVTPNISDYNTLIKSPSLQNTLRPNQYILLIKNVSAFDLLNATRVDNAKFQNDYQSMQATPDNKITGLTMTPSAMQSKNSQIAIIADEAMPNVRGGRVKAFIAKIGANNVIVMPRSLYSKLPDQNNPMGVLTPDGRESLEHEAGHSAQPAPANAQSSYNTRAGGNASEMFLKYLNDHAEIGVRIAKFKNINSKQTLKSELLRGMESNQASMSALAIDALPDDEIERFLMFFNPQGWVKTIMSSPRIQKQQNADANSIHSQYILPLYNNMRANYQDLYQLLLVLSKKKSDHFSSGENDKQQTLKNYKDFVELLKFGYDRVAKGNTNTSGQDRQMA